MAYDLCRVIETVKTDAGVFPLAKAASSKEFTFWSPPVRIGLGKQINKGASGVIYHGKFGEGAVAIKINNPRRVKLRTDADEVRMQTQLYCHVRDRGLPAAAARIPDTLFAARLPGHGRALGMQRMDRDLLAHVQALRSSAAQVGELRRVLKSLAQLLAVLQKDLEFMHGDLHGGNVMLGERGAVFLIDFGMASIKKRGGGRDVTDDRYEGEAFHPHLDFLTLLTALREDLALSKHVAAAQWCGAFVRPFWETVRQGLFAGKERSKLKYGAQYTVRSARTELEESGEIYYAHHLLYEAIGKVDYPPCSPAGMLRALNTQSTVKKESEWRSRIFEDV